MIPQFEPRIKLKYAIDTFKQIMSGWIGFGGAIDSFEDSLKTHLHCENVVTCNSGTSALIMAIKSLNLKPGSTILFPAYGFVAGANASRFLGYNVRLVDINEKTLCMDPNKIKITKDVSCVIFVNHNAYMGEDTYKVKRSCDKHGIPMIQDTAQCIANIKPLVGDLGILSFSVPKMVTTGQGGAVFTNNTELYHKCIQTMDQGGNWRKTKIHNNIGVNFKFNSILAAYGLAQMKDMHNIIGTKKRIHSAYKKYLGKYSNQLVDYGQQFTWMTIFKTKSATDLVAHLKNNDIQGVQYYRPINSHPPYEDGIVYEAAKEASTQLVYLPSSLTLSNRQIKKIANAIITYEEK